MATPRNYPSLLRARLKLLAEHGGDMRRASLAAGMSDSGFRQSITDARAMGLEPADDDPVPAYEAPVYDPPILETADEDLDTLIGRMVEARSREARARQSAEWMRFTVHDVEPFALVFIGDPHIDVCDIGLLKKHVEVIEQTPHMWAVGLGDWINGWVGKLRGQYAFQSVTERDAYRLAQWLLNKDIWWLILYGNHDGQRWHGEGSPLKWMETAVPVAREWQAKFSVGCGDRVWKIWAAHDFPGNSMWNATHGSDKRAQMTGAVADLFVAGDHHTFKISHDQHPHTSKVYWSVRARGYKPLDHYALEKGYGEQTIGHSVGAVFDPRTGNLTCFADVEETAAYLTFLCLRRLKA